MGLGKSLGGGQSGIIKLRTLARKANLEAASHEDKMKAKMEMEGGQSGEDL